MSWAVLGCGYVGERLAACLCARGEEVVATSRRAERAAELAERVPGLRVEVVSGIPDTGRVVPAGAIVVDSIPAAPHVAELVAALASPPRRYVYLSATSVYPRGDGGWIDEDSPTLPDHPRLAEERALQAAGLDWVSLRLAAIYGPGRGVHERLRAGTYRVVGEGATWLSRVHVDDLVSVILAAGTAPALARRAYVVADDEPATSRAHADGAAALLGLSPPPSVPLSSVPPDIAAMHTANRRVRNARLKTELGVTLRYPSWRDGLRSLLDVI